MLLNYTSTFEAIEMDSDDASSTTTSVHSTPASGATFDESIEPIAEHGSIPDTVYTFQQDSASEIHMEAEIEGMRVVSESSSLSTSRPSTPPRAPAITPTISPCFVDIDDGDFSIFPLVREYTRELKGIKESEIENCKWNRYQGRKWQIDNRNKEHKLVDLSFKESVYLFQLFASTQTYYKARNEFLSDDELLRRGNQKQFNQVAHDLYHFTHKNGSKLDSREDFEPNGDYYTSMQNYLQHYFKEVFSFHRAFVEKKAEEENQKEPEDERKLKTGKWWVEKPLEESSPFLKTGKCSGKRWIVVTTGLSMDSMCDMEPVYAYFTQLTPEERLARKPYPEMPDDHAPEYEFCAFSLVIDQEIERKKLFDPLDGMPIPPNFEWDRFDHRIEIRNALNEHIFKHDANHSRVLKAFERRGHGQNNYENYEQWEKRVDMRGCMKKGIENTIKRLEKGRELDIVRVQRYKGKYQYLFPIYIPIFGEIKQHFDLALILDMKEKKRNDDIPEDSTDPNHYYYKASTVLDPDSAWSNSRILGKVNLVWLQSVKEIQKKNKKSHGDDANVDIEDDMSQMSDMAQQTIISRKYKNMNNSRPFGIGHDSNCDNWRQQCVVPGTVALPSSPTTNNHSNTPRETTVPVISSLNASTTNFVAESTDLSPTSALLAVSTSPTSPEGNWIQSSKKKGRCAVAFTSTSSFISQTQSQSQSQIHTPYNPIWKAELMKLMHDDEWYIFNSKYNDHRWKGALKNPKYMKGSSYIVFEEKESIQDDLINFDVSGIPEHDRPVQCRVKCSIQFATNKDGKEYGQVMPGTLKRQDQISRASNTPPILEPRSELQRMRSSA